MMRHYSFSEPGGHPENQDAFSIAHHPADPSCFVCAIADGQGGRAGAAQAAQLAVQIVQATAAKMPVQKLTRPESWRTILKQADAAVAKDPRAGFTTLIGFTVLQTQLVGASNGDSALVTIFENRFADSITSQQRKNPPIGSGSASIVPFTAQLSSPWKVLAVTDGVWKYAGMNFVHLAGQLLSGEKIIDDLSERARLPASGQFQDDFTILILER